MADGRSVGWTIGNAIVPQHHDKAKGTVGGLLAVLIRDNNLIEYSTLLY